MASLASELPSDILRLIFELLDQPAVLSCAAVCHGWRATAVLDRSYYCALTLVFPTPEVQKPRVTNQRHTPGTTLDTLLQAVSEAEKFKFGISLNIGVRTDWEALSSALLEDVQDPTLDVAVQQHIADILEVEKELVPALPRVIPHLVRIEMQVETDFAPQLLSAFTVPAPLLRVLKVQIAFLAEDWGQPLPRDLFSGHAPLLKEVSLTGLELHAPTPCFANALMLQFKSTAPGQLPALILCFPRVIRLALQSLRLSPKDPVSPEETAFCGRLRSLYVGRFIDCTTLAHTLPSISRIPDVELCAVDVDVLAEVLGRPAPDELILSEHVLQEWPDKDSSHLRVQLHAPSATRRMNSCVQYDVTLRALALSSAALSLTKLTVDDRHVRSLMQACPSMPLLEHLRVILIAWSAASPWEPNQEIDCCVSCARTILFRNPLSAEKRVFITVIGELADFPVPRVILMHDLKLHLFNSPLRSTTLINLYTTENNCRCQELRFSRFWGLPEHSLTCSNVNWWSPRALAGPV